MASKFVRRSLADKLVDETDRSADSSRSKADAWAAPLAGRGLPTVQEATSAPASQEQVASGGGSFDVLSRIRVAKPSERRDRKWEKKNRSRGFRGVLPNIREAIKSLAAVEGVSTGAVVEILLSYSILRFHRGDLQIAPVLKAGRLTLFPETVDEKRGKKSLRWAEKTWGLKPPQKKKPERKKAGSQQWKEMISYRISDETWNAFQAIRSFQGQGLGDPLPAGELFNFLVGRSLDAYESGQLVLFSEEPGNE